MPIIQEYGFPSLVRTLVFILVGWLFFGSVFVIDVTGEQITPRNFIFFSPQVYFLYLFLTFLLILSLLYVPILVVAYQKKSIIKITEKYIYIKTHKTVIVDRCKGYYVEIHPQGIFVRSKKHPSIYIPSFLMKDAKYIEPAIREFLDQAVRLR